MKINVFVASNVAGSIRRMNVPNAFQYDVFLSHSSRDRQAVQQLAGRLKADGLRVWLDDWIIQPGDSIPLAIEQGLESSRTLVLVMSKNAFASDWVTLERHTALFRDPSNQRRRFVPIRLDDSEIKDSLRQFAYVDWRERDEQQYSRLLKACQPRELEQKTKNPSRKVLRGPKCSIWSIAVTPDNEFALCAGADDVVRIWDLNSLCFVGDLLGHQAGVSCVAVTADGKRVLTGSHDHTVRMWDLASKRCIGVLKGHSGEVLCVDITSDGRFGISGGTDGAVLVWNLTLVRHLGCLGGHRDSVCDVLFTPNGKCAVTASDDGTVKMWDVQTGDCVATLEEGLRIHAVAIALRGERIVTACEDNTLRLWDVHTASRIALLEGHTKRITDLTVNADGQRVISASYDKTLRIWDSQSGACLGTYHGHGSAVLSVAITEDGCRVVSGTRRGRVRIWDLPEHDFAIPGNMHYTNAKVLLVGDSGVGKSGLAIRLAGGKFEPTISTDAHWVTQLRLPQESTSEGIDREVWLWDFGGQADYRLIHQLFMDETALAVLVFNPQAEGLFEGLGQWDRDLARAARRGFAKMLVAGRCDRGALIISRAAVEDFAHRRGFADYIETSALTGQGCDELRNAIVRWINWDSIPWTTSPRIFKLLKDEILRLRDEGVVLLRMGELNQQLQMRLVGETFTIEEVRAVVGLLAGPGLVCKLEFGDIVMLQPEWINKYAAAVIRSVRAHVGDIGVIDEAKVLAGELNYTFDIASQETNGENKTVKIEMQRLDPSDEAIVLRAMHQMFVDHGLCVREEMEAGWRHLIFPSYFKQELPTEPGHPPILVTYQFDGYAEEIYATLVVQLWRTKAFESGRLWRYAVDFKSPSGARLGLKMNRHEDKNPEICVYFDPDVQDDTKVTFIKYVHEHLLAKGSNVVRLRAFVCPYCGHPVRDAELAREILNEDGANAEIRCQQRKCDKRFSLWDIIEQKFASEEFQERVRQLENEAKAAIDNESRELILEGHARVIAGEAGQIYRGYTGSDHGIDGEIEFKNDLGYASGKRLYLQLKSGDSYLHRRTSDGAEVFQIKKERWASYWREQAYPVMLVIRTSDGEIRWMNVTQYLEENSKAGKTAVRQIEFDGQPFTAINVLRMRKRLVPPISGT